MSNSLIVLIVIVVLLVRGIVYGVATKKVLEYRGYFFEDWFWIGFIFGFTALLVAMARPDNNANVIKRRKALKPVVTNPNSEWKCRKCKTVNPPYTGTCSCGNTREENDAPLRAMQERREAELRAMANEQNRQDSELDNLLTLAAYKDLLDKGVITAADFEQKRKELLP